MLYTGSSDYNKTTACNHYQCGKFEVIRWISFVFRGSRYRIAATHGHSVIKVPVEDTCSYLDHNVVIDNSGRHAIATALGETIKAALLAWGSRSSRLASVLLKGAT